MSRCCIWRIFWTGIVTTENRVSRCDTVLGGGGGGIFPVWKFCGLGSVLYFFKDQRNEFAATGVSFCIAGAREVPPSPQPSPPGRGRNICRVLARLGASCASAATQPTHTRWGACERLPDFPSAFERFSLSPGERAGVRAGVALTSRGQAFSRATIRIRSLTTRRGASAAARFILQRPWAALNFVQSGWLAKQPQRGCVLQPRVARNELPWVPAHTNQSTPTGLCQHRHVRSQPRWGCQIIPAPSQGSPRGAGNPGLEDAAPLGLKIPRRARQETGMRQHSSTRS